ncbi:MAG: hypothetical protein E6F99_21715 [Actinobacteria bacterium]|nr:MAG: hypothetical protein E6F99_21715 [Actinomycetota bacterium]
MLRRLTPYLIAAAVALTSTLGFVSRPATGAPGEHADYVIIAGAAGLRWDDVNAVDTPTLWQLAQNGAVGALSVTSAHTPTCPVDGWLSLGAGNFALWSDDEVVNPDCPTKTPDIRSPDGIGAFLPDVDPKVNGVNDRQAYGAQPGALAEAVRCTAAVGPGAAVAAARASGRVDRYQAALPDRPQALLDTCILSIVDLGTIMGTSPQLRQVAARQADQALARVLAARPARSLVLVAGLSDTDRTSRLHVAIADGPGYPAGWLTSSSTSRPGYLQLTDLAPTALTALNRPVPEKLFAGQPAVSIAGRPSDLATAVSRLADADREAGAQRRVTGGFLTVLAVAQLVLFAALVPFLRRARRYAGPRGPRPMPPRLVLTLEVLLVAASLTLPAALVADAVPWWRTDAAGAIFSAVTVAVVAALTCAVTLGPWRRGALGPLGAVAGIVATIVGVDVLTGARLQLNGVAGYSALEGGRYAGLGTVGLGLLLASILLLAGWLGQRFRRRWRPVVIAVVGGIGVVLVGSPYLGANAGGAVALTAGTCVAVAICTGGFLTFARLAWAVLTGLLVTTGFALLDLLRPPGDRGSLGRILTEAQNGTGAAAIHRTGAATAAALASPLTLVVIASGVMLMLVLLRPWGGLKRLFGLYPAVRAVFIGVGVAGLLAGLLDGAAFVVAGAAAATAMPLACLAALRVLDRADDRTGGPARTGEEAEATAAVLAEQTSDSPARVPRPARRRPRAAWTRTAWSRTAWSRTAWSRTAWRLRGRGRVAPVVPAVPAASNGAASNVAANGAAPNGAAVADGVPAAANGAAAADGPAVPPAVCPPAGGGGDVLP